MAREYWRYFVSREYGHVVRHNCDWCTDAGHGNALPITPKQMNTMTVVVGTGAFAQTCSDLTLAGNTLSNQLFDRFAAEGLLRDFHIRIEEITNVSGGDGNGTDITTYYY